MCALCRLNQAAGRPAEPSSRNPPKPDPRTHPPDFTSSSPSRPRAHHMHPSRSARHPRPSSTALLTEQRLSSRSCCHALETGMTSQIGDVLASHLAASDEFGRDRIGAQTRAVVGERAARHFARARLEQDDRGGGRAAGERRADGCIRGVDGVGNGMEVATGERRDDGARETSAGSAAARRARGVPLGVGEALMGSGNLFTARRASGVAMGVGVTSTGSATACTARRVRRSVTRLMSFIAGDLLRVRSSTRGWSAGCRGGGWAWMATHLRVDVLKSGYRSKMMSAGSNRSE